MVVVIAAGCSSAPAVSTAPGASHAPVVVQLGPRVNVSPAAALFTEVGQTRHLTATLVDASGKQTTGAASWSSSHPETTG